MNRALFLLAVAACETPVPTLQVTFAGPPSQECPSTECSDIQMLCPTAMSIRIVDPDDASREYHWQCSELSSNPKADICPLFSVNLKPSLLPVKRLEAQVALYPMASLPRDSETGAVLVDEAGELACPRNVSFSAIGFPVEQAPTPALGGRGYYHPGDSAVTVTLGCTDLSSINESCVLENPVSVSATVEDFNTGIPVGSTSSLASQLRVAVGEPRAQGASYVLNAVDVHDLNVVVEGQIARWSRAVDIALSKHVCIEVIDENAQTPTTVRCSQVVAGKALDDLHGVWISRDNVRRLLDAVTDQASGFPDLPAQGLTIGVVVDELFNPLPEFTVMSSTGQVRYLNLDGKFVGSATSDSGLFVSDDAVFGTTFVAHGNKLVQTNVGIGGLIDGKLTVVILVASPPP